MGNQDQMEGMIDMMVEQSKLSDELFEKFKVEEEEFNTAMIHYNLMNDPEITSIIMQNMRKLGLGGGMGGGFMWAASYRLSNKCCSYSLY